MALPLILIIAIFFILIFGGLILLQIFLSRKPNPWLGVILPIASTFITFMILFITFVGALFFTHPISDVVVIEPDDNAEFEIFDDDKFDDRYDFDEDYDFEFPDDFEDHDYDDFEFPDDFDDHAELEIYDGNTLEDGGIGPIISFAFGMIPVALLSLLPSVILFAIYLICRQTIKKRSEMEKMHIQDLE
jgi:hypothetical protein